MEKYKCEICGSPILKEGPNDYECCVCHKKYTLEEIQYELPDELGNGDFNSIVEGIDAEDDYTLAQNIVEFINNTSDEYKEDASLFVETLLRAHYLNSIKDVNEEYFIESPYLEKDFMDLYRDVVNGRDYVHTICELTKGLISYDYIMMSCSNYIVGIGIKAKTSAIESWDSYSKNEDNWHELMKSLDNIIKLIDSLNQYGNVIIPAGYDVLNNCHLKVMSTTFEHKYWSYDRYLTQYVGLTDEAKAARQKEIDAYIKMKCDTELKGIEAKVACMTQRINKYWEEHPEDKKRLEDKKNGYKKHIDDLKAQQNAINADKEINELKDEIMLTNTKLSALGFFAFKDKNECKEKICNLENEVEKYKEKVRIEKSKLQDQIDLDLQNIKNIDDELNKDR